MLKAKIQQPVIPAAKLLEIVFKRDLEPLERVFTVTRLVRPIRLVPLQQIFRHRRNNGS